MNAALLKLLYGEENLYPKQLEHHYPRIVEKIINLWHTPQMEEFFQELMVNSRSDRQGFSHEIVSEILHLSEVFEGTCHLPHIHEEYPLAQLNNHPARKGNFAHSPQEFINIHAPGDDGPWALISSDNRNQIEALGYPCSASGFLKAAGAKDLKAISIFLRCNINIDTCDERGWTPLTFASYNGSFDLVNLVIKLGANINIRDNGGFTPLHWAAFNGHTEVIKHLIIKGAEVNAHSLRDWTPLMMAAMNGHVKACAALLLSGADSNVKTHHEWSALQMASFNNHVPVIRLFLSLLKQHTNVVRHAEDDSSL